MQAINLFSLIGKHLHWQQQALTGIFRSHAGALTRMTLLRVFSQLLQILALFLPLKIILVLTAGESSVRLLGQANTRLLDDWLLFLTIGVVVSYLLSVVVSLVANRINVSLSSALVDQLGGFSETAEQESRITEDRFRGMLYKLFTLYAEIALLLIGTLLLFWLDGFVTLIAIGGLVIEVMMTHAVLQARHGLAGKLCAAIKRNPLAFVHYLSSFNFILFFLALLMEHLLLAPLDAVMAILTLLVARRLTRAVGYIGTNAIKLEKTAEDGQFQMLLGIPQLKSTNSAH